MLLASTCFRPIVLRNMPAPWVVVVVVALNSNSKLHFVLMFSNLREQAASILHNYMSICLLWPKGVNAEKIYCSLSCPWILPFSLLASLLSFLPCVHASLKCVLMTPVCHHPSEHPCGPKKRPWCACAAHLRVIKEILLRVVFNDPDPRASLQADWLSACAGTFTGLHPTSLFTHALGMEMQPDSNNTWFISSPRRHSHMYFYICFRVSAFVCMWYTNKWQ